MSFVLLGILNSQAAGGGAIDPSTLNPDLWLDASDASTITASSGSVSQWNNKGSKENFTQATSADQPTTGVATQNGLNVIRFNSDFLEGSTASEWKFMHDGTQYFMVAAVKLGFSADSGRLNAVYGNTGGSNSNIGASFSYDDRDSRVNEHRYNVPNGGGDTTRAVLLRDDGFGVGNTFAIASNLLDPDNGTAANRITYFRNNVQGSDTNTYSDTPSASNPTYALQIGTLGNDLFPAEMELAELIVVSGASATETNRQSMVDYLNAKWSIF